MHGKESVMSGTKFHNDILVLRCDILGAVKSVVAFRGDGVDSLLTDMHMHLYNSMRH